MGVAGRLAALAIGLASGAAIAMVLLPRADLGAGAAAAPAVHSVVGWDEAESLAGVPLYAPRGEGEPAELLVHGVSGDATRPVEARFADALIMVQAHRDLLPPENLGRLVSVSGADSSWWQTANDGRRLVARFDDTLVLLWGRSDDALVAIAESLMRVDAAGSQP